MLVFVAHLSQPTESSDNEDRKRAMHILRKASNTLVSNTSESGLTFVHLNPESLEFVLCIDATFATNADNSSQLGVVIMLRDTGTGRVNIIHYSSKKSKFICKSVLAAELLALVDGSDAAMAAKSTVSTIASH